MSTQVPDGVRGVDVGDGGADRYYGETRPELRQLVPVTARRILDVGCGAGALGAALKADLVDAEVIGIEAFPVAADMAEEVLDGVLRLDLQQLPELPYEHGHFDVMIFGDVLEHMHDPHGVLTALRPYLAPDGVIVCSIPNVGHWSVIGPLMLNDRWTYGDSGLLDRTHVHFFTLYEVDQMMAATGFEVVHLGATSNGEVAPFLAAIAGLVGRYGGDRAESLARMNAYQFLVTARPTD
jgi:2-polyprenyl-3-methyl-5-hydroxy-6-metoxy-1,4-benzoquinol methylase